MNAPNLQAGSTIAAQPASARIAARFRGLMTLAALGLVLALTTNTRAASPSLGAIRPIGGQRGAETVFNLTGGRLADAKEVLFAEPGFTVTKLEVVNDGHVKVTVKIAPDCRLGLHDVRLRTGTGISELRTLSVGPFPSVDEKEPNSDFQAPQPIAMNVSVHGVVESEDVDNYVVDAKKGERISAEIEGFRAGITTFDPYVAILDTKRFELSSSDDSALVYQDGYASIVAPADGKYIVQVRDSAYQGNGSCVYRLHVGTFPRATATVPAGGKMGETLDVKWIGDVLGDRVSKVALPNQIVPNFGIVNQDEKGASPYPNAFRISPYGNVIETEPNDDHNTATKFEAPLACNGVINKAGDIDHFVFAAKKGQTYDIRVWARSLRSPLDSVMYLGKKGGGALLGNDDAFGPDSGFRFAAPEDAEYVIWIIDQLKKGGPDYFYRIEMTPVEPRITLNPSVEQIPLGTGAIAAAVPKGNRMAMLMYGGRADFGGEVKYEVKNLPDGVTMEADVLAASQGVIPVLFNAKPDAPLAAKLASFSATHNDPKHPKISSIFSPSVYLVLGQNNVPVWTRTLDTMPVAVVEESPFSIEIVEPKVPLVQNGSMNLKVVAKRKEGFTAPISLSMPWLPPNVGASGGITIPEKQNEALIPMNANGSAELRTWKIVVVGSSNTATGPLTVSTQLANLTIAAPFLGLSFLATSVEQGKATDLAVNVTKNVDFPGEAQVTLLGLPNKVTTDPSKLTKDTKELVFKLKTDPASPAGNHVNLFCQVVVTQNGEPIVHNIGTGQLRIDVPLPPKVVAAAPAPAAAPKPAAPAAAPAPAPEKRLTRLEKLRVEAQERAKAATPAPAAGGK